MKQAGYLCTDAEIAALRKQLRDTQERARTAVEKRARLNNANGARYE